MVVERKRITEEQYKRALEYDASMAIPVEDKKFHNARKPELLTVGTKFFVKYERDGMSKAEFDNIVQVIQAMSEEEQKVVAFALEDHIVVGELLDRLSSMKDEHEAHKRIPTLLDRRKQRFDIDDFSEFGG